jgi:UDP-N-acetylglucosamine 4,6-dehydratase
MEFMDLNDKVVLITGGTGSFGKQFIKTALTRYKPRKLIVFSRDEMKQYEMAMDPLFSGHQKILRYFIGDVRDANRLQMATREVDYVIHTAALKHVPAAEYNPFECIYTNVLGAQNVVEACLFNKVKRVIALSTDKAANPVNLYGASKLCSDKIFVAANNLSGSLGTKFSIVRYGNVVGSRGSVVPYFKKLIEEGATSLPITDPEMTRFWITLPQGVDFVLSSLKTMQGGEIFVPKIPSMRIMDLAQAMAPKLKTHIVGIRPGEKIHEIMVTSDDARQTSDMKDRYIIQPSFIFDGQEEHVYKSLVPKDFSYSSDKNDVWVNQDEMLALIASSGLDEFTTPIPQTIKRAV